MEYQFPFPTTVDLVRVDSKCLIVVVKFAKLRLNERRDILAEFLDCQK